MNPLPTDEDVNREDKAANPKRSNQENSNDQAPTTKKRFNEAESQQDNQHNSTNDPVSETERIVQNSTLNCLASDFIPPNVRLINQFAPPQVQQTHAHHPHLHRHNHLQPNHRGCPNQMHRNFTRLWLDQQNRIELQRNSYLRRHNGFIQSQIRPNNNIPNQQSASSNIDSNSSSNEIQSSDEVANEQQSERPLLHHYNFHQHHHHSNHHFQPIFLSHLNQNMLHHSHLNPSSTLVHFHNDQMHQLPRYHFLNQSIEDIIRFEENFLNLTDRKSVV